MNAWLISAGGGEQRSLGVALVVVCAIVICGLSSGSSRADEGTPEVAASPISLNSLGYPVAATKRATLTVASNEFVIRDARTNAEVYRGNVTAMETAPDAGKPVFVADFSELRRPGTYRLEIADGQTSPDFQVSDDVYNWPFYTSIRAMYLWRCGTEVSGEFGGTVFHHPACHLKDAYLDYVGHQKGEMKDGVGGWHDAGDYNKYTGNAAFTVGMMLKAWEHYRDRLEPLVLNIPESNNHTPDYLDEARWELEWLLKMQVGDGRAYHKLSTLKFGGFIPPEEETEPRFYCPSGSAGTADFAAVMAQAARVYEPFDKQFAGRCLEAAKAGYQFLRDHPKNALPNQRAFRTGGYTSEDADDRIWMAAELWETTGERQYLEDFEQRLTAQEGTCVDSDWDWGTVQNLGSFTYLLSARSGRDEAVVARVREDALRSAAEIQEAVEQNEYARPLGSAYYWGCNGTVARVAMNLHVAGKLTGKSEFQAATLDALNFLFGRNPFGRSFVTGLGHQPPLHPHDRRNGGDDSLPAWPGYLVGGGWPGPMDWHDATGDYRTNEIAINWNGALIYAMAALVNPAAFEASVAEAANTASRSSSD